LCGITLLTLTAAAGHSMKELGLQAPRARAGLSILLSGVLATGMVLGVAALLGEKPPVNGDWPPARDLWQYSIWAMVQEFILQSFFYVRLESVLGSESAVIAAALLFSLAHLPNPVLTVATLVGGLFFCEMFRRTRSIFPLGIIHAALGLALAETIPDHWMHHMRVGIGYLHFHLH
jgi:Type II CAAX prenyl endopeptidase Rce1-like